MRKKFINGLALLSLFTCILFPISTSAKTLQLPIRDMQTHYWSTTLQNKPQPSDSGLLWSEEAYGNYWGERYWASDLTISNSVNFLLYENGDLFLSTDENFSENSFSKVMGNVKSISQISVPLYKSRETVEVKSSSNKYSQYKIENDSELVLNVNLSTILTDDGALYIMGSPNDIPQINKNLTTENLNVVSREIYPNSTRGWDILTTVSIEMLFPFAYQAVPNTPIKVADNIENLSPYYYLSETSYTSERGFFIDKRGNAYFGFPGLNESKTSANQNLVNYISYFSTELMLFEDGSLYSANERVSNNIKDFTPTLYLLNDGTLYDYGHNLVDREVKAIYKSSNYNSHYEDRILWSRDYYIKYDESLWGDNGHGYSKIMDDVSSIFQEYAVRTNGEVFTIEVSENGSLLPRKIMNGNGLSTKPAAKIHEGKIFKDASDWALVDLRSARTSGLTLPVQELSYNKAITREKFSEIAVKLYENLAQKSAPSSNKNPFKDTNNPEILKAYELGIVKGTSATTFSPQANITREEVATILKRTVDIAGKSLQKGSIKNFSDYAQISSWAKDAVSAMSAANIVKGLSETTFAPKQNTTIEQAVIMANRLVK
ncbi:S-layer homology domain-containing protein [Paenibacillus sp. CAU 1782]